MHTMHSNVNMEAFLMQRNYYPVLQALLAALLFGLSAPLAKLLLGEVQPVPWPPCCIWEAAQVLF